MSEEEGQVGEVDVEMGGQGDGGNPDPGTQNSEPESGPQLEQLRAELDGIRSGWLESHRWALLAENAGKVVPELVAGSTVEELERSVEVARSAFETARAALAEMAATQVSAGNPVRRDPSVEAMSPMEKIAYGLKRE